DLEELELAALDFHVAELAVENVADLSEIARAAGALVVDLLSLGERPQSLDGAEDLDAAALRDLADVVAQRLPRRLFRLGDRQGDDADPVGGLALVGVWLGNSEPLRGELEGRRVDVR